MRKTMPAWLGLLPLLAGCYTTGGYDTARLVEPGTYEVVPFYNQSRLTWREDFSIGRVDVDDEKMANTLGAQVLLPTSDRVNFRLRAEWIDLDGADWYAARMGPKFSLLRDRLALDLPLGIYFGEDVDEGESLHALPALIGTLPLSGPLSLSGTLRYHHYFDRDNNNLLEVDLGAEYRAKPTLALRPEIGWLWMEGADQRYFHFGLGLAIGIGKP